MNQTQHQRWAEVMGFRLLLKTTAHNKKRQDRSRAIEATACSGLSGQSRQLCERAKKLVCRKTSTGSHIEYKKRELFTRKAITSCMSISQRNSFSYHEKYLSVEGVFQPRTNLLDDVSASLASTQQTQAQVRIGTVCICEPNPMGKSHACQLQG